MINGEKNTNFKYNFFNYKNITATVNCIKLINLENKRYEKQNKNKSQ